MLYKRNIYSTLESEIETQEVIIITGMRRVGKTTALTHLYDLIESKNKALFDFENPLHRKVFEEENYDAIWNNFFQFGLENKSKAYIFIDEAQYLPEVSRSVKYLYDHYEIKFFLTGSSSYYLRNLFPESLAGRKVIFELFPLTFEEFLEFNGIERNVSNSYHERAVKKNEISFKKLIPLYQEYMEFGGFPKIVLEQNHDRKKVLLSEIFTSYFEKDAKNLADFRDMSKLRDLILLLAVRVGSGIEINKLASTLSVSRETVYSYLSFLEQTYFISLLPKYSGSIDRQSAGSKKLFFCDSGIANILGKLAQGQLFEQSVYQNLRIGHRVCFYNKDGKSEIDFIIDEKIAMEVKTTLSNRDIAHLKKRVHSLAIPEYYVVGLNFLKNTHSIVATDL